MASTMAKPSGRSSDASENCNRVLKQTLSVHSSEGTSQTLDSSQSSRGAPAASDHRSEFLELTMSVQLQGGIFRKLDLNKLSEGPSAALESPGKILRRSLSSKSSNSAERLEPPASARLEYRIIGLGTCGTVFELPGTQFAYKKGSDIEAMWNDFLLTNTVHNAIIDTRGMLQNAFEGTAIPRAPMCHDFRLPNSKPWWEANLHRFPRQHRHQGAVFSVDRIFPLPRIARDALIKLYFCDDEEIHQAAMNDEENERCLVRVYLGEKETAEQQDISYESLRNFPMRLNMIEDLGLDVSALAAEMAVGLAIIHWQAQVDAMDTEFVLGSAAIGPLERKGYSKCTPPHEVRSVDFIRGPVHLWMLDLDKASRIELTKTDVDKKLVPAFLGNDPYYPRPDVDEESWDVFCSTYLKASKLILESKERNGSAMGLPQRFLDKVAENVKEHQNWDPEAEIVFGE